MSLPLEELCPSCGEFVSALNESTGFCDSCSGIDVGVLIEKTPTKSKIELWLQSNADIIESSMISDNVTAKVAISQLVQQAKPRCKVCNDEMPHTTAGRHLFCRKKEKCRKARRYYRYLVYEKNISKDEALRRTLERVSS